MKDTSASNSAELAITWSITSSEDGVNTLEICNFLPTGTALRGGRAQQITFHSALFPGAAISTAEGGSVIGSSGVGNEWAVYVLTNDAIVHRISVPSGASGRSRGFGVRAEHISTYSVAEHAAALGTPTALLIVGSTLCISGSSGSILCLPDGAFRAGTLKPLVASDVHVAVPRLTF